METMLHGCRVVIVVEAKMQAGFKEHGTWKSIKPKTCSLCIAFEYWFNYSSLGNQEWLSLLLCFTRRTEWFQHKFSGSNSNFPFSLPQSQIPEKGALIGTAWMKCPLLVPVASRTGIQNRNMVAESPPLWEMELGGIWSMHSPRRILTRCFWASARSIGK